MSRRVNVQGHGSCASCATSADRHGGRVILLTSSTDMPMALQLHHHPVADFEAGVAFSPVADLGDDEKQSPTTPNHDGPTQSFSVARNLADSDRPAPRVL